MDYINILKFFFCIFCIFIIIAVPIYFFYDSFKDIDFTGIFRKYKKNDKNDLDKEILLNNTSIKKCDWEK